MGLAKRFEVYFFSISTDTLCLQGTWIPRSQGLAIFVVTTTTTDKTDCFSPCTFVQSNYVHVLTLWGVMLNSVMAAKYKEYPILCANDWTMICVSGLWQPGAIPFLMLTFSSEPIKVVENIDDWSWLATYQTVLDRAFIPFMSVLGSRLEKHHRFFPSFKVCVFSMRPNCTISRTLGPPSTHVLITTGTAWEDYFTPQKEAQCFWHLGCEKSAAQQEILRGYWSGGWWHGYVQQPVSLLAA